MLKTKARKGAKPAAKPAKAAKGKKPAAKKSDPDHLASVLALAKQIAAKVGGVKEWSISTGTASSLRGNGAPVKRSYQPMNACVLYGASRGGRTVPSNHAQQAACLAVGKHLADHRPAKGNDYVVLIWDNANQSAKAVPAADLKTAKALVNRGGAAGDEGEIYDISPKSAKSAMSRWADYWGDPKLIVDSTK